MDRMKRGYGREKDVNSSPGGQQSPMIISPVNRHVRSGSTGMANPRKSQNNAAKAAAQRLAQVMSHQLSDEDEDSGDDLDFGTGIIGLSTGRRPVRSRSPLPPPTSMRSLPSVNSMEQLSSNRPSVAGGSSQSVNTTEQPPSDRSKFGGRSYQFTNNIEQPSPARSKTSGRPVLSINNYDDEPPSAHLLSSGRSASVPTGNFMDQISSGRPSVSINATEQPPSARSTASSGSVLSINTVDQPLSARLASGVRQASVPVPDPSVNYAEQISSDRSNLAARPFHSINTTEQPLSAHSAIGGRTPTSTGRPLKGIRTVPMVPAAIPISLRTTTSSIPAEAPTDSRKDKRLSLDFGNLNFKNTGSRHSDSGLQDELDMLQEENESLLEKVMPKTYLKLSLHVPSDLHSSCPWSDRVKEVGN